MSEWTEEDGEEARLEELRLPPESVRRLADVHQRIVQRP